MCVSREAMDREHGAPRRLNDLKGSHKNKDGKERVRYNYAGRKTGKDLIKLKSEGIRMMNSHARPNKEWENPHPLRSGLVPIYKKGSKGIPAWEESSAERPSKHRHRRDREWIGCYIIKSKKTLGIAEAPNSRTRKKIKRQRKTPSKKVLMIEQGPEIKITQP